MIEVYSRPEQVTRYLQLRLLRLLDKPGAMLVTYAQFLVVGSGMTVAVDYVDDENANHGGLVVRGAMFFIEPQLHTCDRTPYDVMVRVESAHQRKGIATSLYKALCDHCPEFKPKRIYDRRDDALGFYRSIGLTPKAQAEETT